MLQLGFGWFVSENEYADLMMSMVNAYGKETLEKYTCPSCDNVAKKGENYCSNCGSKIKTHMEIRVNKLYDPEEHLSEQFNICFADDDDDDEMTFISYAVSSLMGDNDLVENYVTEFDIRDHLDHEGIAIAKMINDEIMVKARIFDDGFYNREWDCR